MKRPTVTVIVRQGGEVVHREQRRAFNAGVRASEAAVREIARAAGAMYEGDRPAREGGTYRREWTSPGRPTATVEVTSTPTE